MEERGVQHAKDIGGHDEQADGTGGHNNITQLVLHNVDFDPASSSIIQ